MTPPPLRTRNTKHPNMSSAGAPDSETNTPPPAPPGGFGSGSLHPNPSFKISTPLHPTTSVSEAAHANHLDTNAHSKGFLTAMHAMGTSSHAEPPFVHPARNDTYPLHRHYACQTLCNWKRCLVTPSTPLWPTLKAWSLP